MERVVSCVDLTEYTSRTVAYGAYLAKKLDIPFEILHVVRPLDLPLEPDGFEDVIERFTALAQKQAESQLEEIKRRVKEKIKIDAEIVARVGHPVEEILEYEGEKPSLLILSAHDSGGFLRFLIGGVSEKVARKAQSPTLVLRPQNEASIGEVSVEKILVPVDFSESSLEAVRLASYFSQKIGSDIFLLHVFKRDLIKSLAKKEEEVEQLIDEWIKEAERKLEEWAKTHNAEPIFREGEPSLEILEISFSIRADLLIMGARGTSLSKKIMLGHTTERILKTSGIPVLVVRKFFKDS
jgi:nucleotide-binding universal stress UspA family protein